MQVLERAKALLYMQSSMAFLERYKQETLLQAAILSQTTLPFQVEVATLMNLKVGAVPIKASGAVALIAMRFGMEMFV